MSKGEVREDDGLVNVICKGEAVEVAVRGDTKHAVLEYNTLGVARGTLVDANA